MLTSKQRAFLRGQANSVDAIFQIGKSGVGEMLKKQVDEALETRELIKIRLLETCETGVREAAEDIAGTVGADVVQVIGRRFVLYRESKENKKIDLKGC